ncbi:MAG: nitrous oxide reductase family maturation protein NosD [Promethearchaeota archaeon]
MGRVIKSNLVLISALCLTNLVFICPLIHYWSINPANSILNLDMAGVKTQSISQIPSQISVQYENHSPIMIIGNDDFMAQAEENDWSGTGTHLSPIIINGLNITGTFNNDLLVIKDSDVHFRISSCLLTQGRVGIKFSNVTNGHVLNNILSNNSDDGISLYQSTNNILAKNIIMNNSGELIVQNGIIIRSSDNNSLIENTISYNRGTGIYLENSEDNILSKNIITNNHFIGVVLFFSENNTLTANILAKNSILGMLLTSSGKNRILDNILINNELHVWGDQLKEFLQGVVTNNSINGRPLVFWQNITSGIVPHGAGQVNLVNCVSIEVTGQDLVGLEGAFCSNLFIHDNYITKNCWNGVSIYYSQNNTFSDNFVTDNEVFGIYLEKTDDSILSGNTISNNSYWGLVLNNNSENNRVLLNAFSGNNNGDLQVNEGSQAFDDGINNIFKYNYWSEWTSPDGNADGIVDSPYSIEGDATNQDLYPFVSQVHFMFGLKVLYPYSGLTVNGTITIEWTAAIDSWGHSITYTVFYSFDGGVLWVVLESSLSPTSYIWDTTTVDNGNYLIKVNASCAEGIWIETFSNGTFTIDNPPSDISGGFNIPANVIGGLILFILIIAALIISIILIKKYE